MSFDFEVLSLGIMTNEAWYQCEYDLWVWSWYWGPEPLSNLACWLTEQVRTGGYNSVGPICNGGLDEPDGWWWIDEENAVARCSFDDTFDQALRTMNRDDRKVLVDELQVAIYETYTEFPPLYLIGLYAMTTANFIGWGDWEAHPARSIISDMLWLWYDLQPSATNTPPVASFEASPSVGGLDQVFSFDASASSDEEDPSAFLEVRWDWEDDGFWDTAWSTDKTEHHQYAERRRSLDRGTASPDGGHRHGGVGSLRLGRH